MSKYYIITTKHGNTDLIRDNFKYKGSLKYQGVDVLNILNYDYIYLDFDDMTFRFREELSLNGMLEYKLIDHDRLNSLLRGTKIDNILDNE